MMIFFPLIKPRYILFIGIILILLMTAFAYFELRQSRIELKQMHEYKGLALMEIIKQSATNSIASESELKDQISERLFNNARWPSEVELHQPLTDSMLHDFAVINTAKRVAFFYVLSGKRSENCTSPNMHVLNARLAHGFDKTIKTKPIFT